MLRASQLRLENKQSLGIMDMADTMGVSKRTLQRHFKAGQYEYNKLRDIVRFNRAIDCLLVNNMNVEATAKYLDFSDRGSFTNAFKRWTGSVATVLCPSTFRQLYRDYV